MSVNLHFDEARNQRRDLKNGETLAVVVLFAETNEKFESEVRNLRERMRAVNTDRCKNREPVGDEMLPERIAFFLRQILPCEQADSVLREFGKDLLVK